MKKKGFTLIELLAVIIILAIIALIATPIIMNVIEKSRTGANLRSAENYIDTVETLVTTEKLAGNIMEGTYEVMPDGNLCSGSLSGSSCNGKVLKVDMSGTKPNAGTIVIENGIVTRVLNLKIGDSTISTNADGELVEMDIAKYDEWDGSTVTAVEDLVVDEENKTVAINGAADLVGLRNAINSGEFTDYNISLNSNVDLQDTEWTPIGTGSTDDYDSHFTGTFDGNGFTVKGLNIVEEDSSNSAVGFFGAVSGQVTIKNVNIEGEISSASKTAGALIGIVADAEGASSNVIIENCSVNVSVESIDAAGIVGRAYNSGLLKISNVENNGDMIANVQESNRGKVSGLIGFHSGGELVIENSVNNGDIIGGSHQGGFIGYAGGTSVTINNSTNNGNVLPGEDTSYNYMDAAGIVGYSEVGVLGTIDNCINNGEIEADKYSGGIIGTVSDDWTVTNSTNNGKITANAGVAGGIAGNLALDVVIENCVNSAEIYGSTGAGGVCGALNSTYLPTGYTAFSFVIKNSAGGTASITTGSTGYAGSIVGVHIAALRYNSITTSVIEPSENNNSTTLDILGGTKSV